MNGPDQVVKRVLDALAARQWDEVIRWTHPDAVQRLAHHAARAVKEALALHADPRLPGLATGREALLREWEINDGGDLDAVSCEDLLRRALGRHCFTDSRLGLDPRRPIDVMSEADGVAHVLIRRRIPVRYAWWCRGAGYTVVATLVLESSGWLLNPESGFFEQLAVKPDPRVATLVRPETVAHAAA